MKTEKIGSRNIVFTYNFSDWNLNLHLILGERYNYIIDTGLGSESITPIKEYLEKNKKQTIVINTHFHWDHIWGNHCFREDTIVSHKLCRNLISENWSEMLNKSGQYKMGEVKECLPNLVFEDGLYFPDDKIKVFYTPGHTVDSISIFDEVDGVLNAGDNIGDTIDDIVPSLKTDMGVYMESIEMYKELNINACVSGHNAILGKNVFERIENAIVV